MVLRIFSACNNDALRVSSNSPHGDTGTPIMNNSNMALGTIFEFTAGYDDCAITMDDTSSDSSSFGDDQASNHVIVDGQGIVANGTSVESESIIYLKQLDDGGNPIDPMITVSVFSKDGDYSDIWGFATDTSLMDGAQYVKVGGSNWGKSSYMDFKDVDGVPCFVAGTLIATPEGERRIEDLRVGDMVCTAEGDAQPVLWVGRSPVTSSGSVTQQPIQFSPGSLGPDLPQRTLLVSPQHRMVLRIGQREVFAPAKSLLPLAGVRQVMGRRDVVYVHVLLPQHSVLMTEGVASESFYPGPMALRMLGEDCAQHLLHEVLQGQPYGPMARPCLRDRDASLWARRNRAFLESDGIELAS
jgi:hypothetical protein